MSLELARGGADLKAVVGFHSGLATSRPEDAANITGSVLVCIGAEDPLIPPDQRLAFEEEMRAGGVDWRMNLYGGAVHSFTNPAADGSNPGARLRTERRRPVVASDARPLRREVRVAAASLVGTDEKQRNEDALAHGRSVATAHVRRYLLAGRWTWAMPPRPGVALGFGSPRRTASNAGRDDGRREGDDPDGHRCSTHHNSKRRSGRSADGRSSDDDIALFHADKRASLVVLDRLIVDTEEDLAVGPQPARRRA